MRRSKPAPWKGVGLVILVVALAALILWWRTAPGSDDIWSSSSYETQQLRIGDQTISLQVADTGPKQQLGLGNRTDIPPDRGMLFPYVSASEDRCFWMQDMNFPIDMIWLDSDRKVVHIEAEVSPDTYPKLFCPDAPAQYVVELHPGSTKRLGLREGSQLDF